MLLEPKTLASSITATHLTPNILLVLRLHIHAHAFASHEIIVPTDTALNMARFQDLPNEIVREVLMIVLPEDLENFASTTKHLFLLSKPFLEKHRQLIRCYTTFNSHPTPCQVQHSGVRDGCSTGPVPTLFKDILNDPRIGRYIREAKFDYLVPIFSDILRSNISDEARALHKQQYDLVDAAVALSEIPELRDQHKRLKDDLPNSCYSGGNLLIVLLLPLLPNLDSLSMKWTGTFGFYLSKIIPHGGVAGIAWLPKLKTVLVEQGDDILGISTRDLQLFTSLPSLKSFTASGINNLDLIAENLPAHDSHTTQLVLLKSDVPTQQFYLFLESFRSLQTFTFECKLSAFGVDSRNRFDPCWIRNTLVAHVKATLQTLTILGPARSYTFMGSLQPFEVLRKVRTESAFLFPDDCDLETWPSRVLPASIHTLELRDDERNRAGKELKPLIKGLARAKRETCLQLEEVSVETNWWEAMDEAGLVELEELCDEVGIILILSPRDEEAD